MKTRILSVAVTILLLCVADAGAFEPGWYGRPILTGPDRAYIQSMHILERPYRPFHFYGNTVRRRHYRGRAVPAPRDFIRGTFSFARRN
ncbi:MAG: hypothetical protein ACC628_17905 [Pirellulaceae bacterium]